MSGTVKINITESAQELRHLLTQQKTKQGFERIQVLYLLKTHFVETVQDIAIMIGRHRVTVQGWLRLYRRGGIKKLLDIGKSSGRPTVIPDWAVEDLKRELAEPEGFSSYKEIQIYLKAVLGISASYDVVHYLVHDKLKARLKRVRPKSYEQDPEAVAQFKKNLPELINAALKTKENQRQAYRRVRYWCEDESCFGLKTIKGRVITLPGVKPVKEVQWERKYYYLYGLVEPASGEHCICELSSCDKESYEAFLKCFSKEYPEDMHIIQVDQAGYHLSQEIMVPENIIFLPQPAHSPEVNPAERLWEYIKGFLEWCLFADLDDLKGKVRQILDTLTEEVVQSLVGWPFILNALSVAGI